MSIEFTCPQCGKAFQVGPSAAGKRARCKQCGLTLRVPRASGQTPLVFGTPVGDEPPPPRTKPKARPAPVSPVHDPYGLNDPGFEIVSDADTGAGPLLLGGREWGREPGPGRFPAFAVLGGLGLLVLLALAAFGLRRAPSEPPPLAADTATDGAGPTEADAPPGRPEPPPAPAQRPPLPPRKGGREVEPGVTFEEVVIGPGRSRPGLPPAHGLTLWLYLPSGPHAAKSLPCVLIAPAGSILIAGNELYDGKGDHPEHLPWVRAGFAVLAYGLDGELSDPGRATGTALRQASEAFRAARAGLTDADAALAWLSANVPEVDPNRVYTAGHSSAATMALLLAEHDPRVKAAVAFAPRPDVATNFDAAQKTELKALLPWLDEFFTTYNPALHADELRVPVFLFHARDDSVVPVGETEAFAAGLERLYPHVRLVTVPSGDHYDAMIRQGLPRAIEWLRAIDRGR